MADFSKKNMLRSWNRLVINGFIPKFDQSIDRHGLPTSVNPIATFGGNQGHDILVGGQILDLVIGRYRYFSDEIPVSLA